MKVLVACEYSGTVRDAFRDRGHEAWSCDILDSERGPRFHYKGDVRNIIQDDWDLIIAHPPCTRLANSGVRWLHERNLWAELDAAVEFYNVFRNAACPRVCIENPVMHKYAKDRLGAAPRQVVQPWWFGDETFKATGYELRGLPPLIATNRLTPPAAGTPEHKAWSWIHRCPPGPDRWKIRSRTPKGIAQAMAEQWGGL